MKHIPIPPKKSKANDLTNKVFGRLTVVKQLSSSPSGLSRWECLCECGKIKDFYGYALTRTTKPSCSCGCINSDRARGGLRTTHGMSGTSTYNAWTNMWKRCTDIKNPDYDVYKDRCPPEEWRLFENFLADMGAKPEASLTLERLDNNKPYGPDNCVWASRSERSVNKSNTLLVEYGGKTLPLKSVTDMLGVGYSLVYYRLKRGWTLQKALTEPVPER